MSKEKDPLFPGQPIPKGERRLKSRDQLSAMKAMRDVEKVGEKQKKKLIKRSLELGMEAAPSVKDRDISLFSRGLYPHFAGINTFLKTPYLEDVRKISDYDAVFVGVPMDCGTTNKTGTRFGPQGLRRASAGFDSFSPDMGVSLIEQLKLGDIGDVFVIPANLEKSFDQIDLAVSHIVEQGVFPIVCGGDHSISYPVLRGLAPHIDGKIGIIHFDRHIDTLERDMDERMHTCPWFHATDIPNCPPTNLVQVGIGGWIGSPGGIKVARDRDTTVISVFDIDEWGIDECVDIALENAWKGAKAVYLSFDIDVHDPGFAPGTGTPEPGGLSPRESLRAVRRVAREGLCAMDLVEVSPPYDVADCTSLLGGRVILDVLGTLVQYGHLGKKAAAANK